MILNRLKRFWKKQTLRLEYPDVKCKMVSKEEMESNHPNALLDLFDKKEDVFLVKDFLSKEEVSLINKNFNDKIKNGAKTNEGYTYPIVFPEYSQRLIGLDDNDKITELNNYFMANESYYTDFKDSYRVDIPKKLNSFFGKISGGRNISIPKGINDIGYYPFTTYRYLFPDLGVITAHCGNFFQKKFTQFYEHLSSSVEVKDQLSFFIVMQQAEKGGELYVYNLRWEDGQTRGHDDSPYEKVILTNGIDIDIDNAIGINAEILNPKAGDLILFQGGSLWHKVSRVEGNSPRITFGGFMGKDKTSGNVVYWS